MPILADPQANTWPPGWGGHPHCHHPTTTAHPPPVIGLVLKPSGDQRRTLREAACQLNKQQFIGRGLNTLPCLEAISRGSYWCWETLMKRGAGLITPAGNDECVCVCECMCVCTRASSKKHTFFLLTRGECIRISSVFVTSCSVTNNSSCIVIREPEHKGVFCSQWS